MSAIGVARGVLVDALPRVQVGTRVPNPRPSRFVRIVRTGGPKGRVTDRPLLVVECWAEDSVQAEADADRVHEALRMAPNFGPWAGGWVSVWECLSIADYPDPDVKQSRFTVTGYLTVI